MKKILNIFLFLMASCSTLSQMNQNMENTNVLLSENSQTMQSSKQAIEENTSEIRRSSNTMQLFPIAWIIFLLIVFIPMVVLFRLYRKLEKRLK